jgi:hypothetical protein
MTARGFLIYVGEVFTLGLLMAVLFAVAYLAGM